MHRKNVAENSAARQVRTEEPLRWDEGTAAGLLPEDAFSRLRFGRRKRAGGHPRQEKRMGSKKENLEA